MRIQLIARPSFLGLPNELGTPRNDQLQGCDAAKLIETAGRTCYDSFGKGRNSLEYAQHILDSGHGSVLEHACFSFFITGVSRGLTHELVRHRVGVAYSQRSTRYVDEDASPWIEHPLLKQYLTQASNVHESREVQAAMTAAIDAGRAAYKLIVGRLQEFARARGADAFTARKQSRGAARGYLGNALETELVCTMNVRTLLLVIGQRAQAAADAEIRELGCGLVDIMQDELDAYFKHLSLEPSPDGLGRIAVKT